MTSTTHRALFLGALGALAFAAAAACASSETSSPRPNADAGSSSASVTYYRDVKPILDAKCVSCHSEGSFAPFPLSSATDAVTQRTAIKAATAAHTMPPWPPSATCTQYAGDRALDAAQRATLSAWGDGTGPLGDPSEFKALSGAPAPKLSRTDFTIPMAEAYTPIVSPDEYRCFLMDWPSTEDTHITGFSVDPGAVPIVHHTLVYVIPPADVAAYQKLDADEAGLGYSCFAGPNKGLDQLPSQVGAWVPGTFGTDYPAGTGIKVVAGSKLVIQMHYNTTTAKPVPDRTSVRVRVDKDVATEAYIMPFTNPLWVKNKSMPIPAGAPDTRHEFSYDAVTAVNLRTKGALAADKPFKVHTAALHQHLHGTRSTLEVTKKDGAAGQCLLDIANWDFHWQGSYSFLEPKTVNPGDAFHIACHWDNSEQNQPLNSDGRRMPPQDLNWGENTTDEMCIGFMYITQQ